MLKKLSSFKAWANAKCSTPFLGKEEKAENNILWTPLSIVMNNWNKEWKYFIVFMRACYQESSWDSLRRKILIKRWKTPYLRQFQIENTRKLNSWSPKVPELNSLALDKEWKDKWTAAIRLASSEIYNYAEFSILLRWIGRQGKKKVWLHCTLQFNLAVYQLSNF